MTSVINNMMGWIIRWSMTSIYKEAVEERKTFQHGIKRKIQFLATLNIMDKHSPEFTY